jgi:hypothetical protein
LDLAKACLAVGGFDEAQTYVCLALANAYYNAVHLLATENYESGQMTSCWCCDGCCDSSQIRCFDQCCPFSNDSASCNAVGNGCAAAPYAWAGVWYNNNAAYWSQISIDCAGNAVYEDGCGSHGAHGSGTVDEAGVYSLSGIGCSDENFLHRGQFTKVSSTVVNLYSELSVDGGSTWTAGWSDNWELKQAVDCTN